MLHELLAYLSFWAMPIAYAFSVGCCCGNPFADSSCSQCNPGTTPLNWQVTFDGVTDLACTDCTDFNTTTFILDNTVACVPEEFDAFPCEGGTLTTFKLPFGVSSPSAFEEYRIRIMRAGAPELVDGDCFKFPLTFPRDCIDDSFTAVACVNGATSFGRNCDWSSATSDFFAINS